MAKKEQKIVIPKVEIATIKLKLSGDSLIINQFSEKSKEEMEKKTMKLATKKKEARKPDEEYEAAKYHDKKGRNCCKASAVKQSFVAAARYCDGLAMTQLREVIYVRAPTRERTRT